MNECCGVAGYSTKSPPPLDPDMGFDDNDYPGEYDDWESLGEFEYEEH